MADITTRLATRDDARVVHRMLARLATDLAKAGEFRSTVADIERHGFGDAPAFEILLAHRASDAVGLATYFPEFSTWRGAPGIYLQDLYVKRSARDSGAGRALMAAVARRARERGAQYLRLSVHRDNQGGAAFYRRLGFREVTSDHIHVLEGPAFAALGDPPAP